MEQWQIKMACDKEAEARQDGKFLPEAGTSPNVTGSSTSFGRKTSIVKGPGIWSIVEVGGEGKLEEDSKEDSKEDQPKSWC